MTLLIYCPRSEKLLNVSHMSGKPGSLSLALSLSLSVCCIYLIISLSLSLTPSPSQQPLMHQYVKGRLYVSRRWLPQWWKRAASLRSGVQAWRWLKGLVTLRRWIRQAMPRQYLLARTSSRVALGQGEACSGD